MILPRMEFWKEGLPRQISHSCLVSSRLTSAGRFEGVFGLQIPYFCMCYVRERNMVANAITDLHPVAGPCWVLHWCVITAPLIICYIVLRAFQPPQQTLSSASSLCLLPCFSSFILELNVVWKVFGLFPPSHVAHMLNITKENWKQSKWAMQGTVLILPAAAGPLKAFLNSSHWCSVMMCWWFYWY